MLEVPQAAGVLVWLPAPAVVLVRFEPTVVTPKLVVPAVLVVVSVVPVEPLTVRFVPATSAPEPEAVIAALRSEEHTSELQSLAALTCRPLLVEPEVSVIAFAPAL